MNRNIFWIFALSSAVYFTQGIEGLPSQSLFYYFKESLHFSPQKIMLLSSVITFAWLIKPPIGYLVDNFFNKKSWIFISLLLSAILALVIFHAQAAIFWLIFLLLVSSACSALRDVSVDGLMCTEGKKYGLTGKIQSVQWISISVAMLFAGLAGGFIAERWSYKTAFLCLVPVYALVCIPAFFYKDTSLKKPSESFFLDISKILSDKRLIIAGLFVFLYKYSPSFGTPLFFIQRDAFGWSKLWIGVLNSISTAFGILGAILYYRLNGRINIKRWLFYSVFVGAVTTLSYLYYTPVTAVIYDTIYSLMGMFVFLMIMDFMARNSTPGLEATAFALLCSISNLSTAVSNFSGAFLLAKTGLGGLIVLSSLTSFLCLFLINKIE